MILADIIHNQMFTGLAGAAVVSAVLFQHDNALLSAINQAGSGVVLIEDIDAVDCGQERRPQMNLTPANVGGPATPQAQSTGISTSGLLNAIDGVAARDGRILIITTNHADKLDEALIRPGRVDMRCHFELAGEPEAHAMFRSFCPEVHIGRFATEIAPDLPLSQAEIQNRLLAIAA